MIVVIDNYDSFTYNLVQYLGEMNSQISVFRNNKITAQQVLDLRPGHILISPGPGTPDDAGITVELIQKVKGQIPLLGVCLGHQAIAQAFGGKVIHAPQLMHGKTSNIHHDGKTIFKGLSNPFTATRYHSLAVDKESIPECLEVTAWTTEGDIMGLRHHDYLIEGVQFHPESILTEGGKRLLKNFLEI